MLSRLPYHIKCFWSIVNRSFSRFAHPALSSSIARAPPPHRLLPAAFAGGRGRRRWRGGDQAADGMKSVEEAWRGNGISKNGGRGMYEKISWRRVKKQRHGGGASKLSVASSGKSGGERK